MSFTLVFSQGKPCCKNKSGKGKLSCKINHAQIDAKMLVKSLHNNIRNEGQNEIQKLKRKCFNMM